MLVTISHHHREWHWNVLHQGKRYTGATKTFSEATAAVDAVVITHFSVRVENNAIVVEGK